MVLIDIKISVDSQPYLLHKLVCNIASYCMNGYFQEPQVSENTAHECNNCNMHTTQC